MWALAKTEDISVGEIYKTECSPYLSFVTNICHLHRALLVTGDYKYRAARLEVLDGLRLVARDYS